MLPYRRERDWSLSHRRLGQSRLPVMTVNVSPTVKVRESKIQKGPPFVLKRDQSVWKGVSTEELMNEHGATLMVTRASELAPADRVAAIERYKMYLGIGYPPGGGGVH